MDKSEWVLMRKYKKGCNICHEEKDKSDFPFICGACTQEILRRGLKLDWGMDKEELKKSANK